MHCTKLGSQICETIEDVVAECESQIGVTIPGVLVGGSYIYGRPDPDSDIDLQLVVPLLTRERRRVSKGALRFDLVLSSERHIHDNIQQERHVGQIHMVARGIILRDYNGAMQRLCEAAKTVIMCGATPLTLNDIRFAQHAALDRICEAQRCQLSDPACCSLLLHDGLIGLVNLWFRIHRLWPPAPKSLILRLHESDPGVAAVVREFFETKDTREQLLLVTTVARLISVLVGRTTHDYRIELAN